MRRIIALITIVIMVVGLLSGCGQNSQTGQSESTQPKEKVLKIWSLQMKQRFSQQLLKRNIQM